MKYRNELDVESRNTSEILNKLFEYSGTDLSQYAPNFIERRFLRILSKHGLRTKNDIFLKLTKDHNFYKEVLREFSITVTEPFRDPEIFAFIRREVIPILETYPFIRIWHAGCATGQEVYSMAILLQEANVLKRSKIYATDVNPSSIAQAKKGELPKEQLEIYCRNYQISGGKFEPLKYLIKKENKYYFRKNITKNINFSVHDLMSDTFIPQIHIIFCRNVFIYFNTLLQQKILSHFSHSLNSHGFLCMGKQEPLNSIDMKQIYEKIIDDMPIYRKKLWTDQNV